MLSQSARKEKRMPYSMITMRAALKSLGVSKGVNPFKWEEKGDVHPELASQFKYGRGQNFLNDLLEYCWLVYSKALNSVGPQFIGRTGDLWVPKQLSKAGITDSKTQTLWDSFTQGNIQVMDKWSPTVNDCWVLGGVHRRANFELVSARTLRNLWDFKMGFHIVTAREILGLLYFGYKLQQQPNRVVLTCQNSAAALNATIEAYDNYMKSMEGKGPDSIRSVLVMDPALQDQIKTFDRSKLKHVTPPR
jgi:hypothetical protein